MSIKEIRYECGIMSAILKKLPSAFAEGFSFSGDIDKTPNNNWRLRLELDPKVTMVAWEVVIARTPDAQKRINELLALGYEMIGDSKQNDASGLVQFMAKRTIAP